ncbi:hypothetical protein ACM26V_13275 [Salipaludibacillus sp. HK11]|uniref:hypothetical protein n=1 Tax=Salipaludibacillus sp. HK11 TaxID=3394320 RepID=UPI0039FD4AC1
MDMIGLEILKSLGRFFLHPLTYVFLLAAFWLGFQRVKRERKDFHTRVFDVIQQVTSPLFIALIVAGIVSVFTIFLGIELPLGMLVLLMAVWLLLLPLRHARWMSVTVIGSLAMIIAPFLPQGGTDWPLLNQWLLGLNQMDLINIAWLLTILFVAESFLILADGWKQPSPAIVKSKRGKLVGEHITSRLWYLPIFLIFPVGSLSGTDWWPLFDLSIGGTFGIALVPFMLGFQAKIKSEYAIDGVKKIGKRLLLVNLIVIVLAVGAYFYPVLLLLIPAVILIGRELIYFTYKAEDKNKISLFTRQEVGMKILGVLPHSTADRMGLEVGEIIVKANGFEVSSQRVFYEALQHNSAYCKLEVLDHNNEMRFASSSIFQGDHYQIGCLFVPDDEMGNLSYRGLRSSVVIHQDRTSTEKSNQTSDEAPFLDLKPESERNSQSESLDLPESIDVVERNDDPESSEESQKELAVAEEKDRVEEEENNEGTVDSNFVEIEKATGDPEMENELDADESNEEVEDNLDKRAYDSGAPYGQASGLSNFYDEFRQTKTNRNKWSPTLDSKEKNQDEPDDK